MFENLTPAQQEIALKRAGMRVQEIKEQAPHALNAIELELKRRELKGFKNFVTYFWDTIEPTQPLSWNWHHDELCDVCERLYRGDETRVVVNIPPGTMKTLLMSVMFRAYIWSQDASQRFLSGSYGGGLSIEHNVKLRTIVTSAKYKVLFPHVVLTGDQNAKERFDTTLGGWSIATSVGGVGTGEHPNYVFVDDPLTEQQSRSAVERKNASSWISGTLSTRGVILNVRVLIVMQRLHEDDPSGYLLSKGGWTHVCLPMRYEGVTLNKDGTAQYPDPRDHRKKVGELLWPEMFSEQKVRQLEIDLGPYGAAGQLQQRPAPEGGGLFKREWFRFVQASPALARRIRCWDTAATAQGGDYTAGVRIAESKNTFYIEHSFRDQLSPAGVDATIYQYALLEHEKCGQRELREPGSSGKTVTDARAKSLKGYDYAEIRVTGDKVTNAKPFRAQCEAGNVCILRTGDHAADAWIEPFISELCNFPTGKNDDQVDAGSGAFNAVLLEPEPMEEFATW